MIHYKKGVPKGSLTSIQHFKFVNWRIRGLVFWCHEQFTYLYKYKFKTHQVFWLKFDDREVSSFHCAKSAPVDFYDFQGNRIRNSANKATVKKSMVTYVERAGGIKLRHETSAFTVKPRGLRFRCKFSAPLSAQPSQEPTVVSNR